MDKNFFSGKVVVVTGASSGIGEQLALQLAEKGATLVLAARNAEQLEIVAVRCLSKGGKVITQTTDVADKSQCKNLINKTIETFGKIDILVNNAGFAVASRFAEMEDLSVFEKIMQTNFMGGVYCTHFALPFLKKSGGQIVAVSSLRGKLPSGTADGYGASKHAMAEFYSSLRNELTGSGIDVTVVYPNWVSTGITSRALKSDGSKTGRTSVHENGAMSAEKCAEKIIKAIAGRKRDIIMTFEGKFGLLLKLLVPRLVDYILIKKTDQ